MDIGQIGDDGWTSIRTCWRGEPWLPAGLALAAVAYVLWIGLTGAALGFLADAVAGEFTVQPWTSVTTFGVALVAILWVLGPAALAAVLAVDRMTNERGNLATTYRLRHPLVLFLPPVALLAVGYGLLVGTGTASGPALAVLVAGALLLAVRTTAYAHRVFSLSLPVVAKVLLFATAATVSVATLVLGGIAVGREALVGDLLAGIAAQADVPAIATAHTETALVGGVPIPLLVAGVIAVPVGGSAAYVGIQLAWSVAVRLYKPTVRRPELRTGQRYPRFARPTTTASPRHVGRTDGSVSQPTGPDDSGSGRSGGSTRTPGGAESGPEPAVAGGAGATAVGDADQGEPASGSGDAGGDAGADGDDEMDEVTHTRVFTPPADADVAMPAEFDDGAGDRETTVTDGSVDRHCPACGAALDYSVAICPDCGEDLESA